MGGSSRPICDIQGTFLYAESRSLNRFSQELTCAGKSAP